MLIVSPQLLQRTLIAFAVFALVGIAWSVSAAKRDVRRGAYLVLLSLSLSLIFALTFPVELDLLTGSYPSIQSGIRSVEMGFSLNALMRALSSFADTPEKVANIALYVPFGFFAQVVMRRGWLVVGSGAALSLLVELWQCFAVIRHGSVADLLHNTTGVVLGVLAFWVFGFVSRLFRPRRAHQTSSDRG
ncbi:VanZ family protein [Catenuloplanes japonicus]|uniref:VanZ family protein n=1 Tax=Catenuloplanes japonicus TaxID=33876 RepID=UPI000A10E6D4|nr:VanZ family protein [Catenuloplanes japonicus]